MAHRAAVESFPPMRAVLPHMPMSLVVMVASTVTALALSTRDQSGKPRRVADIIPSVGALNRSRVLSKRCVQSSCKKIGNLSLSNRKRRSHRRVHR